MGGSVVRVQDTRRARGGWGGAWTVCDPRASGDRSREAARPRAWPRRGRSLTVARREAATPPRATGSERLLTLALAGGARVSERRAPRRAPSTPSPQRIPWLYLSACGGRARDNAAAPVGRYRAASAPAGGEGWLDQTRDPTDTCLIRSFSYDSLRYIIAAGALLARRAASAQRRRLAGRRSSGRGEAQVSRAGGRLVGGSWHSVPVRS